MKTCLPSTTDRAMLEGTNLRGQTPICGFLRFPAKICGFFFFFKNQCFPNAHYVPRLTPNLTSNQRVRVRFGLGPGAGVDGGGGSSGSGSGSTFFLGGGGVRVRVRVRGERAEYCFESTVSEKRTH